MPVPPKQSGARQLALGWRLHKGGSRARITPDRDTGKLLWTFDAGDEIWTTPAVGDIKNDGSKDIITASKADKILCLKSYLKKGFKNSD